MLDTIENSVEKLADIDDEVNSFAGNFVLFSYKFVHIVRDAFEELLHIRVIFAEIIDLLDDFDHFVDVHVFEFIILEALVFELVVHFLLYEAAVGFSVDQHVRFHLLSHRSERVNYVKSLCNSFINLSHFKPNRQTKQNKIRK